MIRDDRKGAAQTLIESMGGGSRWSMEEMMAMLGDPSIKYTTAPENVIKYAHFMHDIGSLKNRASGVSDLFFPGIDLQAGH